MIGLRGPGAHLQSCLSQKGPKVQTPPVVPRVFNWRFQYFRHEDLMLFLLQPSYDEQHTRIKDIWQQVLSVLELIIPTSSSKLSRISLAVFSNSVFTFSWLSFISFCIVQFRLMNLWCIFAFSAFNSFMTAAFQQPPASKSFLRCLVISTILSARSWMLNVTVLNVIYTSQWQCPQVSSDVHTCPRNCWMVNKSVNTAPF